MATYEASDAVVQGEIVDNQTGFDDADCIARNGFIGSLAGVPATTLTRSTPRGPRRVLPVSQGDRCGIMDSFGALDPTSLAILERSAGGASYCVYNAALQGVPMRICDTGYLKALRRKVQQARKALPPEVAKAIDLEIEEIKAQGGDGPWYSSATIGKAFNVSRNDIVHRTNLGATAFQGSLPTCGPFLYGDWFEACGVNKDTRYYRTWPYPAMAIEALDLAHHLDRYGIQSRRARKLHRQKEN